jgi:hypothetical protein
MLQKDVIEGESLERLVVRTPPLAGSDATERHVVPPKISQLMAEQHGKFDGVAMDGTSIGYALAGREAGALNDGATQVKKTYGFNPRRSSRSPICRIRRRVVPRCSVCPRSQGLIRARSLSTAHGPIRCRSACG